MKDTRSTEEIFESHLKLRLEGKVEEDIRTNYAEDVTLITWSRTYHGHDGVRQSAAELASYIPNGNYTYKKKVVEGNIAYLIWTGESKDKEVNDGTDTFLISEGKIQVQTIYYDVDHK